MTDGEFRRAWWHLDFLEGLVGIEKYEMTGGMAFSGVNTRPEGVHVVDKIGFDGHPMIAHYNFLAANTSKVAKQCIPAPSALYGRRGREAVSSDAYPSLDAFWSDLGEAYRQAVNAFVAAGCRYIQLDEVYLVMLCDEGHRAQMIARGEDPDALATIYGDLINAALADVPEGVTTAMHMCRGNFKSTHLGEGAYDRIARVLFERIRIHGYFMEYDTERAGGFEPLADLPADRRVVAGPRLVEARRARGPRHDRLARRAGIALHAARPARPQPAMRLRLHRGRQSGRRGRAMGEAGLGRRHGPRDLGRLTMTDAPPPPHRRPPVDVDAIIDRGKAGPYQYWVVALCGAVMFLRRAGRQHDDVPGAFAGEGMGAQPRDAEPDLHDRAAERGARLDRQRARGRPLGAGAT